MPKKKKESKENFKCEICGKNFKTKSGLSGHKFFKHSSSQPQTYSPTYQDNSLEEKRKSLEEKKLSIQDLELTQKLKQLQGQTQQSSSDDFDKELNRMLKVETLNSLRQKQPQQQNQSNPNSEILKYILQNQSTQSQNFQNFLISKLDSPQTSSNVKDEIKNILEIAQSLGYNKGDGGGLSAFGSTLQSLFPLFREFLEQKKAEQNNPPHRIINTYPQNNLEPQKKEEQVSSSAPPPERPQPAPLSNPNPNNPNPNNPTSNPQPNEKQLRDYAKAQGFFDDNLETDPLGVIQQSITGRQPKK